MSRSALIASLTLLAFVTPALADATAAQRAACTPDVMRLCAGDIPDVDAIKVCLKRERPRLSVACRSVMDAASSPNQRVSSAGTPARTAE